ncbi:hypothetical protein BGZ72_011110 [Mortierella alpina]|nr:hypothetical protein BGZ72_011110 [Mortierella alpina]
MYTYNTLHGYTANITKTLIPGAPYSYRGFAAVWSTVRNSVLFYGGYVGDSLDSPYVGLMEYQPSNNQWVNITSHGANAPGPVRMPCMDSGIANEPYDISVMVNVGYSHYWRLIMLVNALNRLHPAYNGTKIVMFGSDRDEPYSVYILDAKTLVWTRGTDPRRHGRETVDPLIACTVVGDYLIVTGGMFGCNTLWNSLLGISLTSVNPLSLSAYGIDEIVLYNIKLNEWTDSYEPPQMSTISTSVETPSTTATAAPVAEQRQPSGEEMASGARTATIAGASSALVILLICGAFLIRRRKMRKISQVGDIDKNLPKYSPECTAKNKNNPQYPPYRGEDMDPYSSTIVNSIPWP